MLNDMALRNLQPAEKPYRRADGGGLFIQVEKGGSKLWRIAYRFRGKQKLLSGGPYPAVGLSAARRWRDDVKEQLARGEDPSAVRRAQKVATDNSFEKIARAWFASRDGVVSERYNRITLNRFEKDVFPVIGDTPIDEVDGPVLLDMLRKIETRGARDLAHRLRVVCGQVFKFAIASGLARYDPACDLAPAMKPKAVVQHRAKIMPSDMGAFLAKLKTERADEMTHLSLRLTILTWARTQEVRFAQWNEFEDLSGRAPLWRIPAERMKMSRAHLIPLSQPAVDIVKRLRKMSPESEWLFPLKSKTGVISENRMLDMLYRMGLRGKATVHGFRGTASTWANETQKYHSDVIELALAHVEKNDVRAAYNAAQLLAPRREMLQEWADWLEEQEMMAEVLG